MLTRKMQNKIFITVIRDVIPQFETVIRGGYKHFHNGAFFKRGKSNFKTIFCKKNQKIPIGNSKRKLQNMVKRKMTGMNCPGVDTHPFFLAKQ